MCSNSSVSVAVVALLCTVVGSAIGWAETPDAAAAKSEAATKAQAESGARAANGRRTPRNPKVAPGNAAPSAPTTSGDDLLAPSSPDLSTSGSMLKSPGSSGSKMSAVDEKPQHTLANCMKIWDAATHMSKAEWKAACVRSIKQANQSWENERASRKKSRQRDY